MRLAVGRLQWNISAAQKPDFAIILNHFQVCHKELDKNWSKGGARLDLCTLKTAVALNSGAKVGIVFQAAK